MAGVPGVPVPVWWPARAHTQQARGGWDNQRVTDPGSATGHWQLDRPLVVVGGGVVVPVTTARPTLNCLAGRTQAGTQRRGCTGNAK